MRRVAEIGHNFKRDTRLLQFAAILSRSDAPVNKSIVLAFSQASECKASLCVRTRGMKEKRERKREKNRERNERISIAHRLSCFLRIIAVSRLKIF